MTELEEKVQELVITLERQIADIRVNMSPKHFVGNIDYQDYLRRLKEGLNDSLAALDKFDTLK